MYIYIYMYAGGTGVPARRRSRLGLQRPPGGVNNHNDSKNHTNDHNIDYTNSNTNRQQ